MSAAIDTHKAIKRLIGAGFSEPQAEAIVESLQQGRPVTKTDLDKVERSLISDLANVEIRVNASMEYHIKALAFRILNCMIANTLTTIGVIVAVAVAIVTLLPH